MSATKVKGATMTSSPAPTPHAASAVATAAQERAIVRPEIDRIDVFVVFTDRPNLCAGMDIKQFCSSPGTDADPQIIRRKHERAISEPAGILDLVHEKADFDWHRDLIRAVFRHDSLSAPA